MEAFYLHVRHKAGGEQQIPMAKPELLVGRLDTNDVILRDSSVTRVHAKICAGEEGFEVIDLGSKNFTFVNGEAVARKRVQEGDEIRIGDNIITLRREQEGPEIVCAVSRTRWDITDEVNPEEMTILSAETDLPEGGRPIGGDPGRLVQIYRLSQRISESIDDYAQLIDDLVGSTYRIFQADRCVLSVLSGSGDSMQAFAHPQGDERTDGRRGLLPDQIAEQVASKTRSFLMRMADTQEEDEGPGGGWSVMYAPLVPQGQRLGFFYLVRRQQKGEFSRWDLEYLTALANLAGIALANARVYRTALDENRRYEEALQSDIRLIGESACMREVYQIVRKVANSQANVLLTGESGTGKELVAKAIHRFSERRLYRFVPINCAAIPESLLESELFGVERGAFTDAKEKPGRIEIAHKGTLFLDEISDMNPPLQAKLLRVLQHKEFERLGGVQTRKVDVRIIAATNRDIREEVSAGRFREDLLYRIQVIRIALPPLRERTEDIPLLVDHFLSTHAEINGTCAKRMSQEAMELLMSYNWTGNVRQLENAIEAALVMSSDWILWPEDFPVEVREGGRGAGATYPSLADVEQVHILKTLRFCGGNKRKTARMLGITRQTLDNKLARYGAKP